MTLADFMAALAQHIAHERGWSLAEATRWVEVRVIEARREHGMAGAPLGDIEQGFIAWLAPRHQPPAA